MIYFEKLKSAVDEDELDKALTFGQEWCAAEKGNYKAWYNLGAINHMLQNYKEADSALLKSISIKPDHDVALSNLASSYCSQCMFEKAIPYFEKALEFMKGTDNESVLIAKLADCHINYENYEEAASLIEEL